MRQFRLAFFLLFWGNLIFFAWGQWYQSNQEVDGREPQRLAAQLKPESISVLDAGINPVVVTTASAGPKPSAPVCRLVAALPNDAAEGLKLAVARMTPEIVVTLRPVTPAPDYLAYLPPLASKQAAQKKLAELKKAGIKDSELVEDDGPDRYSILLDAFETEQLARDYAAALAKKGIRTVRVEKQQRDADKAELELRGTGDKFVPPLADLVAKSGATVSDCPPR